VACSKVRFRIDLGADTVTSAGVSASIRCNRDGSGTAGFPLMCGGCPLRAQWTIAASAHEDVLAPARQTDWL
jgi:hypothetical protein